VLSSLAFAGVGIMLFPRKAGVLPGVEDRSNQIHSKLGVYLQRFLLIRAFLLCKFLVVE